MPIESATCRDAQVVRPYRVSNPLRLTALTAKSEDYNTAPQHLPCAHSKILRNIVKYRLIRFLFRIVKRFIGELGGGLIKRGAKKSFYETFNSHLIG